MCSRAVTPGEKDASRRWFQSYQRFLFFTPCFNSFSIHSLQFPLVTPSIVSYISLATFLNHDTKTAHFSSTTCFFLNHVKQTIYPWPGYGWWAQHDTRRFQWSSRWQFRIRWRSLSATIQAGNCRVSTKAIGKLPSQDSFTTTLGKRAAATQTFLHWHDLYIMSVGRALLFRRRRMNSSLRCCHPRRYSLERLNH